MGTANQIEQELMNYISDHKIRNTHSHHLPEQAALDLQIVCTAVCPTEKVEQAVEGCQRCVDGGR